MTDSFCRNLGHFIEVILSNADTKLKGRSFRRLNTLVTEDSAYFEWIFFVNILLLII